MPAVLRLLLALVAPVPLAGTAALAVPVDSGAIPDGDRPAVMSQLQIVLETERSNVERIFRTPSAVVLVTPFAAFSRRTRAPCGDCGDPCRPFRMQYQQTSAQEFPIIEGARCRTAEGRWVGFEERVVGKIDLRPPPPVPAPPAQASAEIRQLAQPPSPPAEPTPVVQSPPPPLPPPPWLADAEIVGLLRSLRYLDGDDANPDRRSYENAVKDFMGDRNLAANTKGPELLKALHGAASREFTIASCGDAMSENGAVCRR